MIKEILDSQNPILRQKSKKVNVIDKKVFSLIRDLIDTLNVQKDPEGVGLAAPQIGKNMCVFVMKPAEITKVVINPEILEIDKFHNTTSPKDKKNILEGCLSLPHYYSPISRAKRLKLKYKDQEGIDKIEIFSGMEAQIIQHEVDHLNGILFVDRLIEQKKPLYEYLDGTWEKVDLLV